MDDEERNIESIDKNSSLDEFILPGFRFHPTDEELVGFYLRRKVEHKPLSIEIIKQIDIYKYDPWDLPKLAITGEKEWYFYCPRDRKYRNSTRPNRVTGAGFWKATGTDRPIYSSQASSKCIGLKKSLVFYKGRAAKGTKTDWMMHEFRLPSVSAKKYLEKITIPENEAWAICKIFKKANSNSWISPTFDNTTVCNTINPAAAANNFYFINNSSNTTLMSNNNSRNDIEQQSSTTSFSHMQYLPPPINPFRNLFQNKPCQDLTSSKCGINDDASSLLLDMSSSMFGGFVEGSENQLDFSNMSENVCQAEVVIKDQLLEDDQLGIIRSMGYGCNSSFPLMSLGDYVWKPNLLWDSSSPCPSDQLSTSYSANKGYT